MREELSERPDAPPDCLEDLSRTEHLLVWALRTVAVGHGECPLLCRAFLDVCGPRGAEAFATYFVLVRLIGNMARRPLRLHAPGCCSLSCDELAILGLIAAAQASLARDDTGLLRLRLDFLLEERAQVAGWKSARAVAELIAGSGQPLPIRLQADQAPRAAEGGGLYLVH